MKDVADLCSEIATILQSDFDMARATSRFGPVRKWIGERARLDAASPQYSEIIVETVRGSFAGVQLSLRDPLDVPWAALRASLGEPVEIPAGVDDWSGPVPYRFDRGPGAVAIIDVAMSHALETQRPTARVVALIVRRWVPEPGVAST